MKVLVLFAHPAFHKSKVNKQLVNDLHKIEGVTLHDLYQEYPDNDIDVRREQKLVSEHDVVVFQFPLFWYSTPPLLKEWQDMVLEHGWAFGSKGDALKGKLFMCSITTGGPQSTYQVGKFHNHTLNQLILPLMQTATLCKMQTIPPFVVHGTHAVDNNDIEYHKQLLHALFKDFTNNTFDLNKALKHNYINEYISKKK